MREHGRGPWQAPARPGPGAAEAGHLRGWRGSSRAAIARQLWDDHYAEIASGCARTVPETETVHAIVEEAFVQLLCRWVPPGDPLGFVVQRVAAMAQERRRQQVRAGATATQQPADHPAANAADLVASRHGAPRSAERDGGDRATVTHPVTIRVLVTQGGRPRPVTGTAD